MIRILKKHRLEVSLFALIFALSSCTPTVLRIEFTKAQEQLVNSLTGTSSSSSLAPQSAGTIDPKVGVGQAILNLKEGDKNLGFNLALSNSGTGLATTGLSVKATTEATALPSSSPSTTTTTSSSTTTSASPSASPATTSTLTKVVSQVTIDGKTYPIEVSADKIQNGKYTISLVGLKDGSIVDMKTDAYDDKNTVVATKTTDKKTVTKDIETVDVPIAISINIKIEQNTTVNVEQNQTVTGPTINVNVTTAGGGGGGGPKPMGPINTDCNQIQPDGTVKLSDGTTFKICPIGTSASSDCLLPKPDGTVTLTNGKTVKVCIDPLSLSGDKPSPVAVTVSSATPSPSAK